MYDIYFDLKAIHETAEEKQPRIRHSREQVEKAFKRGVIAAEEASLAVEWGDEELIFNFELDLPTLNDDYAVIVNDDSSDGCTCNHCGEFYPYAEGPNQDDGTFKCYSCRLTS